MPSCRIASRTFGFFNRKDQLHKCGLFVIPKQFLWNLLSECQCNRTNDDGFTGTGLSCQNIKSFFKFYLCLCNKSEGSSHVDFVTYILLLLFRSIFLLLFYNFPKLFHDVHRVIGRTDHTQNRVVSRK